MNQVLKPLWRVEQAHRGLAVTAVFGVVDGTQVVVSGGADRVIRVWNPFSGQQLRHWIGHVGWVRSVAAGVVRGRAIVVSGGDDSEVAVWDAASGQPIIRCLGHEDQVRSVALGTVAGQDVVVSGGDDGIVRVWDPLTGRSLRYWRGGSTRVLSTAIGDIAGQDVVVSGGDDGIVRVWDAASGRLLQHWRGHDGWTQTVGLDTFDGRTVVVSGGDDGVVRTWDTGSNQGGPLPQKHQDRVRSVALGTMAGRGVVVSGSAGGAVWVRDLVTGESLHQWNDLSGGVLAVGWGVLRGRDTILAGQGDGAVWLRDMTDTDRTVRLEGHRGRVLAVGVGMLRGRPVVVSGGDDGVVRAWDAADGRQERSWGRHMGRVWSVGLGTAGDQDTVVSGGGEGLVQIWEAWKRRRVTLRSRHLGRVRSVALGAVDTRGTVVSGGEDGMVRVWDVASGNSVVSWQGHAGWVRSVVLGSLGGQEVVVSGGEDGKIQISKASSGERIRSWSGHDDWVRSVALGTVDGQEVVVSGGRDGALRVWDAASGDMLREWRGDSNGAGTVIGVVTVALGTVSGQDVVVFGGDDEKVRVWDAVSGELRCVWQGHEGWVRSVALGVVGGQEVVVSGGDDGSLAMWPLNLDDERCLSSRSVTGDQVLLDRRTLALSDTGPRQDHLGRLILSAYLAETLVGISRHDRRGTAVVHLNGRWGSGKSMIVDLLEEQAPGNHLVDPIVVRYDAWRESAVAPAWWSLAVAVHRGVRSERARATQGWMSALDLTGRLVRARSFTTVVLTLLVLAVAQWRHWLPSWDALGETVTVVMALTAIALVGGRALFWASPIFGHLHLRNDDDPLAGVSSAVARLRRWSPRRTREQSYLDTALVLVATLIGVWFVSLVARGYRPQDMYSVIQALTRWGYPLLAMAFTVVLLNGAFLVGKKGRVCDPARRPAEPQPSDAERETGSRATGRGGPQGTADADHEPPSRGRILADHLVLVGLPALIGVGVVLVFGVSSPGRLPPFVLAHPDGVAVLALAGVFLVHLGLTWRLSRERERSGSGRGRWRQRRPVLLVIDDIDRCTAERVVKILETVHTLLREPDRSRWCWGWRDPAPFLVLVVGDGRWIRSAFDTHYSPAQTRCQPAGTFGDDVRGLGADFIQKLFDHTVLVPALTPGQVTHYVGVVTGQDPETGQGRSGDVPEPDPGDDGQTPAPDGGPRQDGSPGLGDQVAGPSTKDRVEQAVEAASPEAVMARTEHLVAAYPQLLPDNPRLIKRVANAWGMLRALQMHLGHDQPDEVMIRAAVMMIRFPDLVDELLSVPDPPESDPGAAPGDSHWGRRDVRQILHGYSARDLAVCFGRVFPEEAPATPEPAAPESSDAATIGQPSDPDTSAQT